MKTRIRPVAGAGLLVLALFAGGCGPRRPVVTPAEGIVTLNGKPLPNATVEFVPTLEGLGPEWSSVGVTDDTGHFTLRCGDKPGAATCVHRVVVREGPVPREARGQSEHAQEALANHVRGLKNRPIPQVYGSVGKTPLQIEVRTDRSTYPVELQR
jgi:hypothetical protein